MLLTRVGPRAARAQCATRLGNIALEARISRSEVGCGELRCPAMALGPGLPVHQPRLLGSESEAAYRRRPLLRCAGLSRLTGILSPNSPLMYFPSSAASGGSSACGASKGVGNLPIRRGKPDASRGWTVRATRKVAGPPPTLPTDRCGMRMDDGLSNAAGCRAAREREDAGPKGDVDSWSPQGPIQRRIAFSEPKAANAEGRLTLSINETGLDVRLSEAQRPSIWSTFFRASTSP